MRICRGRAEDYTDTLKATLPRPLSITWRRGWWGNIQMGMLGAMVFPAFLFLALLVSAFQSPGRASVEKGN
ncbi:MAG: hypothetical protein HFG71_09240 [Hungatella sp.]|nr:hypothetical protein [Hungatella sp.]